MVDNFNFDDSYQPPTTEFIRNSLTYGLMQEGAPLNQLVRGSAYGYSDFESVGRNRGRLVKRLVQLAYENKRKIQRIPVLSKLALYVKRRMMNQTLSNFKRIVPKLDLSGIMGLDVVNFIMQLYILALGRAPNEKDMENSKIALCTGMPKEALAYITCTSKEFADRAQVVYLDEYRKAYRDYRLRNGLRRLPVIGWIWAIAAMPRRIHKLEIDERLHYVDNIPHDRQRFEALAAALETANQRERERFEALSAALETANQNIITANVKLDETASLMIKLADRDRPFVYGLPGGVAAVQTKEFIFGVPSEEWRLAVYLSSGGTFEPGTEKYFRSILKEGMQVLDIGANLGIYTLHALAAGCHVYSYEPTPRIYKILLDNIGINGFEPTGRAHVYNLAVSDIEGEVEFAIFDINEHQNNSIFKKNMNDKTIKVKTVSLDKHLNSVTRIDVVKIDVEGAEPLVLKGMRKIIANNPDIKIIMEFAPSNLKRGGVEPANFIKTIRTMDLDIHVIDTQSGDIFDISNDELCQAFSVNVLLQRTHLKAIARE